MTLALDCKKRGLLLLLAFTGCASLPPTNLPVCGHTEQFETICRAPVACLKKPDPENVYWMDDPTWCDKTIEIGRDYAWEKANTCPTLTPINAGTDPARYGACYEFAGARDSRQVYRRVLRTRDGITK